MKTALQVAGVLVVVVLSIGLLFAQGFGARTGMWQFTITMKGDLGPLPPEVAKELARPQTTNSCVTAADLKNLNLGRTEDGDDEDCKILSSKVTPTSVDFVRQCTGDDPLTETSHFDAPTPQTMTGTITRKTAEGTMVMTMAGKWLAAACKE